MKKTVLFVMILCLVVAFSGVSAFAIEQVPEKADVSLRSIAYFDTWLDKSGSTAKVSYEIDTYGSTKVVVKVQMQQSVNGSWVNYGSAVSTTYTSTNYVYDTKSISISDSGAFRAYVTVTETASSSGQIYTGNKGTNSVGF